MVESLIDYVKKLNKEYYRCLNIDTELSSNRSENYYYNTRSELLRKIINDLNNIIKTIKEKENE